MRQPYSMLFYQGVVNTCILSTLVMMSCRRCRPPAQSMQPKLCSRCMLWGGHRCILSFYTDIVKQAVPAICAIHAANRRQSGDSEDVSEGPAGDTKEVPPKPRASAWDQAQSSRLTFNATSHAPLLSPRV